MSKPSDITTIPDSTSFGNEDEKIDYLYTKRASKEVLEYLSQQFKNLTIVIPEKEKGNIMDLMNHKLLEGWCFQTTETSIIFLNDTDYIERGYLWLNPYESYYHSWICFTYQNEEYAFDPCLDIFCQKRFYSKIFDTDIKARVYAEKVREFFINKVEQDKYVRWKNTGIYIERNINKIKIVGSGEVTAPMYGNNTEYEVDIDNRKIKRLVAHYCKNN